MNIHEWVVRNIPKTGTIIEAGMYDGTDTKFFCSYFSQGKVYGFEPVPSLFDQAKQKINNFSNVEIYQVGLSDKTGSEKMYLSDISNSVCGSSSLLKPKDHLTIHKDITFKNELEINTTTLDDWLFGKNINTIDFMWLDIQGSEPNVLAASPKTMGITKYLYSEVSLIETYDGVIMYPDFKVFLENNNFEMVFEDLPWKDMGNVLYRNKNLT